MSKFSQTLFSGAAKTRTAVAFFGRNAVRLNLITLVMLVIFAAAYIVQVNGSVAKGYAIRELEDQMRQLSLDNQKLEVTVREAQSLQNVTRSVKMLGLVAAETPKYLASATPAVAMR